MKQSPAFIELSGDDLLITSPTRLALYLLNYVGSEIIAGKAGLLNTDWIVHFGSETIVANLGVIC